MMVEHARGCLCRRCWRPEVSIRSVAAPSRWRMLATEGLSWLCAIAAGAALWLLADRALGLLR